MKAITNKNQLWDVHAIPMQHGYGEDYPDPDAKMLIRSDTKERLAVLDNNYPVIQNKQTYGHMLKAANEIGIDNPSIQYGEAYGGRRVVFQLQIPSWKIRGEEIKRYLTTFNSHDKSSSYGTDYLTDPLFCSNQFYSKYRDAMKIRHIGDVERRINKFITNFINAYYHNDKEAELYQDMAETYFDPDNIEEFVLNLLNYTEEDLTDNVRKTNKYNRVEDAILTEINNRGENQWAAYNGVTYYTNHMVERKNKDAYLIFNEGRKMPEKALKILRPDAFEIAETVE